MICLARGYPLFGLGTCLHFKYYTLLHPGVTSIYMSGFQFTRDTLCHPKHTYLAASLYSLAEEETYPMHTYLVVTALDSLQLAFFRCSVTSFHMVSILEDL